MKIGENGEKYVSERCWKRVKILGFYLTQNDGHPK